MDRLQIALRHKRSPDLPDLIRTHHQECLCPCHCLRLGLLCPLRPLLGERPRPGLRCLLAQLLGRLSNLMGLAGRLLGLAGRLLGLAGRLAGRLGAPRLGLLSDDGGAQCCFVCHFAR